MTKLFSDDLLKGIKQGLEFALDCMDGSIMEQKIKEIDIELQARKPQHIRIGESTIYPMVKSVFEW